MLLTTFAVVVLPVLIVTLLREGGVVEGIVPLLFAGLALSFGLSALGAALWKTRPGSGDLLFGDLIVWGFLRRWLIDRRLSSATKILGQRDESGDELTPAEKVELLEKLSGALEARDPYTHGHSRRVARHSTTMAKRMGLSREQVARIRTAAAIHDVGKVDTPRDVLGKEGRLTDDEYEVIKEHPVVGAEMASDLRDPELTEMVRHHHERLDGGGYPDGLGGEAIPLGARIIAVADTFDAITSARPYRPGTAHKKALDVLQSESGTQLDPDAVEAFRSYYSGLRPVAIWAVIANAPQRMFARVFDELGAGVASASKAMATAAAVVVGATATQAVDFAAPASGSAGSGAAQPALTSTPFPGPVFVALPGAPGAQGSPGQPGGKPPLGPGAAATTLGRGPQGSALPAYADPEAAPGAGHSEGSGQGPEPWRGPDDRPPKADAPAQESETVEPTRGDGEPTRGDDSRADSGADQGGNSGSTEQPAKVNDSGGGNPGKGGGNSSGGNPGSGGGAPGNSGNAPGHSGEAPGNSGNAPGHSGEAPGNSGSAPGHSGEAPGNSGSAPGGGPPSGPSGGGSSGDSASSGSSGSSGSPGNSGSSAGGGPPPGAGKRET